MPDPPPPPPRPDAPPASSPSSPPPPLANRPPRPAYASDNDYHYQRSLWARRPPPPTAPPPPPAPPTTPLLPPSRPPARRPSAASYAAPLPSSAASRALARSLSARASARAAFEADVDAVYFAHTDFATVLATDMRAVLAGDRSLGGVEPGVVRTRAQWRRVRRRMCEVFPAGCARPRRFSRSFLEGEREELGTFRRDARAVLRKAALGEAVDVHSGARLGRLWWQRYGSGSISAPDFGGGGSHSTSVRLDGHVDGGGGGAGVEMGVALGSENWLAHRLFRQHEEMLRMQQLPNASDSASREDEGIGGGSRAVGLTSPVPLPAPFGGPTPGPQTGDAAVSPPMDLILPPVPPYLAAPPGSGSVCTSPPPPPGMHRSLKRARDASVAGLRPEYQAKNVDFRTSGGAALLAKALARQALGQLPEEDKLKNCGAPLRADVIECVSACVSLIIRARATRSSESAEDLIDALRVKCPENEHLIVNIKNAVREFDDTSTDSR